MPGAQNRPRPGSWFQPGRDSEPPLEQRRASVTPRPSLSSRISAAVAAGAEHDRSGASWWPWRWLPLRTRMLALTCDRGDDGERSIAKVEGSHGRAPAGGFHPGARPQSWKLRNAEGEGQSSVGAPEPSAAEMVNGRETESWRVRHSYRSECLVVPWPAVTEPAGRRAASAALDRTFRRKRSSRRCRWLAWSGTDVPVACAGSRGCATSRRVRI